MARPVKKGLDYFPLDVDFFEKEEIKFFSLECGTSGICALIKLICNIYRNGYYIDWKKDNETLFSWDMRGMVAKDEVPRIIEICLKRGIFSEKLYKKHNILTSLDIQEVFLQALDGKRQINIIKEYWLARMPEKATVTRINGGKTMDNVTADNDIQEKKGDNDSKKGFIPPSYEEVKEYFEESGYTETAAKTAFNYYNAGDWRDSKGKSVRNWKQKMIAVWFKPEYLKTSQNHEHKQQLVTF